MQESVDRRSQYDTTFRTIPDNQCCGGHHWWEWTLLLVTLVNTCCLLSFSAVDMSYAIDENATGSPELGFKGIANKLVPVPAAIIEISNVNPAFTFDLAMMITSAIASALVLYGLFAEKKYELIIIPLIMSVAIIFCLAEYIVNNTNQNKIKLARLALCATLIAISIPLTRRTVSEHYWTEYHIVGASDGLLGMYRRLRYFNALLKLDAFFLIFLGMFSLIAGLNSPGGQLASCIGCFVYAILCLTLGSFAVNLEMKLLVYGFVIFTILLPLVVPIQIMAFGLQCALTQLQMECSETKKLTVGCLISAAIMAIILRTYILLILLQVYRHFGYGLTDAAFAGLIANESTSLLGRSRRRF